METEQKTEYSIEDELQAEPFAETAEPFAETAEPPVGDAVRAMVFGIISTQLAYIPFFGIAGIVFAVLARRWALPIIEGYPYTGARLFAKAGRITGTVGLILSIVATAFWGFYFFILIPGIILLSAILA